MYHDSMYKNPLKLGEEYQEKVKKKIKEVLGIEIHYYTTKKEQYTIGESKEGYEIKYDRWINKSNRMSIEIGEKTRKELKEFSPSGIFRIDNTIFYVQGDDITIWIFKKKSLLKYFIAHYPMPIIEDKPPTIQKFYIDVQTADQLAERKIKL